MLLIAGFGGNANSKVYKKMRNTFADKYNLVTIQCDYFGWEFMQDVNDVSLNLEQFHLNKLLKKEEINSLYEDQDKLERLIKGFTDNGIKVLAKENINESLDNYNDMGLIQTLDNISAVISVIEIIKDNGYNFNMDKVILYGHSHGTYLSYLANAFAPHIFSLLIDNSSWLIPGYLRKNRYVKLGYGESIIYVEFSYLAKKLDYDEEILYLPSLYKRFDNQCEIICYHGIDDRLISNSDKKELKEIIKNFNYNEISEKEVDGKILKSTEHGLDANFLELFDFTMDRYKLNFDNKKKTNLNLFYLKMKKVNILLTIAIWYHSYK